jgi:hypothetical protein
MVTGGCGKAGTHASCKIPDAARRRGDNPTLEMMLADGVLLFIERAPPIIRSVQNAKRKPHPTTPAGRCRIRIKRTGKERVA